MQKKILSWQTDDKVTKKKSRAWYWTVGILALGGAVASIILENILLGVLIIFGAAAIMLAGSRPPVRRTCGLSETGLHIGATIIPYANISEFAIEENEPRSLTVRTSGLTGIVSIPLETADFRQIRSELKNRNVNEVDEIPSLSARISEWIGM